jgi:hypothetical protein
MKGVRTAFTAAVTYTPDKNTTEMNEKKLLLNGRMIALARTTTIR